jgi:DDE family transposase
MVARGSVCIRRVGEGRSGEVRFGRFLANPHVTVEGVIEGWGEQTAVAASGRHVLAIQDTSDINFRTTPKRRRGLGEIGRGSGRGVLIHAMLALDAETDACLGLVGGKVWTRKGRVRVAHAKRTLKNKESRRWLTTAARAKTVLSAAAMVTIVSDRESDIYAAWARVPEEGFHLLTRAMQDRATVEGGGLYAAGNRLPIMDTAAISVRAGEEGRQRQAKLCLRFGRVALKRPRNTVERHLPACVPVSLVEVVETDGPAGVEPIHWRLLTTHEVPDVATAWRIVGWYKARWTIEQLWRLMKKQGLRIEESQIETADRLVKLTAIAAKAAVVTLQLLQARDGQTAEMASVAFDDDEIGALEALNPTREGKTQLQKNPHQPRSLAWAAWIVARLGGWDGYPSSKPPGPITLKRGLEYLYIFTAGRQSRDVCIP